MYIKLGIVLAKHTKITLYYFESYKLTNFHFVEGNPDFFVCFVLYLITL